MAEKHWYVLQAHTGYEQLVKQHLERRIKDAADSGLVDKFDEVVVPSEEVIEMRSGKKRKSQRKIFPGYVLVKMALDDETWHFVKGIPYASGFLGSGDRPTPLSEKEAANILQQMREGAEKPKPKVLYEPGEVVRIVDGPFTDFNGVVEEVNYDKNFVRVSVLIFGRSTPVDLEFSQIEKG